MTRILTASRQGRSSATLLGVGCGYILEKKGSAIRPIGVLSCVLLVYGKKGECGHIILRIRVGRAHAHHSAANII